MARRRAGDRARVRAPPRRPAVAPPPARPAVGAGSGTAGARAGVRAARSALGRAAARPLVRPARRGARCGWPTSATAGCSTRTSTRSSARRRPRSVRRGRGRAGSRMSAPGSTARSSASVTSCVDLEQVKHWSISSVLRVVDRRPRPVLQGRRSGCRSSSTRPWSRSRLARRFPDYVPAPLAVEPERGWMLLPAFDELFGWDAPLDDAQGGAAPLRRPAAAHDRDDEGAARATAASIAGSTSSRPRSSRCWTTRSRSPSWTRTRSPGCGD